MKTTSFNLYRYQIIPKDRYFQGALFGEIQSVTDLIAHKNKFFYDALKNTTEWRGKRTLVKGECIYDMNDFLLYKFAPRRTTKIENEHFQEEQYDDWPSILIAFWNDEDKQIIAIQDRKKAFQNTKSVADMIADTLNLTLLHQQLKVFIEPRFHKEAFWNIIKTNEHKVKNVAFELITPNMANISHALSEDLKSMAKNTNTMKTKLEIDAEDSVLHIEDDDKQINSLVDYASEGGGDISIKVKGIKKRIHTSKSIKTIEINELDMNGDTKIIVDFLKKLIA